MTAARKWFLLSSVLVVLLTVVTMMLLLKSPLVSIHRVIERDYKSVAHISAAHFSQLNSNEVVIFDVREPEEFLVSHIAGAIQVAPNIEPSAFIDEYGGLLKGKSVVFYCSVGRRSSKLTNKLGDTLSQYGASSSQNLIGCIFSWVNQGRELISSGQLVTTKVHPYNEFWGRLVDNKQSVSYRKEL